MQGLINSADPLLTLAGALFLIGVAFDFIFSSQFKNQIRDAIAKTGILPRKPRNILLLYSEYFVQDIIGYEYKIGFFIKSLSLSVLCYLLVAFFETKYSGFPFPMQEMLLSNVALLSGPVLVVCLFQMAFDWFSSYISILYFRLFYVKY